MPRFIGVDPGERRTGLAVGDTETRLAFPLGIIDVRDRGRVWLAKQIARRAAAEGANGFVLGLPLNMDGSHGPQARWSERLGAALASESGLRVILWDERLSTFVAEQRAAEDPRRRGRPADDLAAAVILQTYLDARDADSGAVGRQEESMDTREQSK